MINIFAGAMLATFIFVGVCNVVVMFKVRDWKEKGLLLEAENES